MFLCVNVSVFLCTCVLPSKKLELCYSISVNMVDGICAFRVNYLLLNWLKTTKVSAFIVPP